VERKEKYNKVGFLLVITGASGAGKDSVMDGILGHDEIKMLGLKKIVTCTDRSPRPGEENGIHYHFVARERLIEMSEDNELVEEITATGTSNKATPKSEIERLLKGEDLVWRIDPSRAAEIASGGFFSKHFPEHAKILQERTIVLCVTAPKEVIETRRKERDKEKYSPDEYKVRDEQELPHLKILYEKAVLIENSQGSLENTVKIAVEAVQKHHAKTRNKK
jgi:guanylate kinase